MEYVSRPIVAFCLILISAACRGIAPVAFNESSLGYSAVLIRGRVFLPTGEINDVKMALNLESSIRRYRLHFKSGKTSLLRIEPDAYQLAPPRSFLGFAQEQLKLRIAGNYYRAALPREILRMEPLDVKPTKVLPIGILEARIIPADRGRPAELLFRLDTSIAARRQLIEDVIAHMMDPKLPTDIQEGSITWSRALEQALLQIQHEAESAPSYKPAQP